MHLFEVIHSFPCGKVNFSESMLYSVQIMKTLIENRSKDLVRGYEDNTLLNN